MPVSPLSLIPGATEGPAPASAPPQVEWGAIDDEGRLVLSPEMRRSLGLEPGARMRIERDGNTLLLHRALGPLAKIYGPPTNGWRAPAAAGPVLSGRHGRGVRCFACAPSTG